MIRSSTLLLSSVTVLAGVVKAGPPYVTDDPAPTDFKHYEIYLFASGTDTREGMSGASGVDFNYGATPDLQLTAVLPVVYERPSNAGTVAGLGNVEMAAKYRFAHQSDFGWDVAVFPRLFFPSGSSRVGEKHFSMLLPVWAGKNWDNWSTFGGGGCVLNRGEGSRDFCLGGWALTRQVAPQLQLGAEIVHQTPDTRAGHASTNVGAGLRYDFNKNYHLLAYAGPGLQNATQTGRYSWYASILLTL